MAHAITIPSPSAILGADHDRDVRPPRRHSPPTSSKNSKNNNNIITRPRARSHSPTSSHNAGRTSPAQGANKKQKKATPRKPPGPVAVAGVDASGGVAKPKQSKSRNGCVTCKAKRLKCDEEKPRCQQCIRRNVDCGGYRKDFKWRPFEETNVKVNIDRQKRGTSPKHQLPGEPSKRGSPPAISRTTSSDKPVADKDKPPDESKAVVDRAATPLHSSLPERPAPPRPKAVPPLAPDAAPLTPVDERPDPMSRSLIPDDMPPPVTMPGFEVHRHDFYPGALSHLTPGLGLSPTLTESLWPFNTEDPMHQDFVNFELPESFRVPSWDESPLSPSLESEQIDNDELDFLARTSGPMPGLTMTSTAGLSTPTASSLADSPEDPRGPVGYIYPQPYLAEDSPEMLTYRFDRLTCGILSIVDGPSENPWRQLIWPMAHQSPALYHAINAMAAYHSATDVPRLRVVGHEHKAASIRFIQEGIRDNSFSVHTAIATALALGLAEAWDRHTNTGNTHLRGAQALVRKALDEHRRAPLEGVELARLKFLCNAWVYMDVMSRLTSFENDESMDFDNILVFSGNPNDGPRTIMGETSPGFGIDFGIMPVDTRLDPLMGCAITLFPLIGRVANLVRKICRSQSNSPAIISQANDIKMALEGWDPPNYIETPEDPTTSVQHTLQTAEAYRWATLLHLHSAVPELPSLTSAELAQRVMQYLATVPLTSRTVIVQMYPLMLAGCEAHTAEDRQWVQNRWAAMNARMRVGMIEKAAMVMEEVWRRRDAWEANPAATRRLVPTSEIQQDRPRSSRPFVRSPSGDVRLTNPGRTGMVFSYVDADGVQSGSDVDDNDIKRRQEKRNRRAMDRRDGRDPRMDLRDPAYTVRGHLHWIGVMWDWGWEILLG